MVSSSYKRIGAGATLFMALMGGGVTHDLRGKLPVSQTSQYTTRKPEQIQGIIIHHSATKGASIRSAARYHIEMKKWPGFAYHYVEGYTGEEYYTNDELLRTYHAPCCNTSAISIVAWGNYQNEYPSAALDSSLTRRVRDIESRYDIKYVLLHRDTKATACPGDSAARMFRKLTYDHR